MFKRMQQNNPLLYVLIIGAITLALLLLASLAVQACATDAGQGERGSAPLNFAVERVSLGGAAKASIDMRLLDAPLVVTITAQGEGEAIQPSASPPCFLVAVAFGGLRASTDYPEGCTSRAGALAPEPQPSSSSPSPTPPPSGNP
jgi:hypothetical protein